MVQVFRTVAGIVGGSLAGFATSWWQSARARRDALMLASRGVADAAAQRILSVLADLERTVDEFDHLIFLLGTPTRDDPTLHDALRDKAKEIEAAHHVLERSLLTDAPLLVEPFLRDSLMELAAALPLVAMPVGRPNDDLQWGGPDGDRAHYAGLAVHAVADGLTASIRRTKVPEGEISAALARL
jgi:hypothetical protein